MTSQPRAVREVAELYAAASDKAVQHVERTARRLLRQNHDLHEFVMGMGSWSVYRKDGTRVDDADPSITDLRKFIEIWDRHLCITGEPARFTRRGKKIADW